jgi:hypothetical protein
MIYSISPGMVGPVGDVIKSTSCWYNGDPKTYVIDSNNSNRVDDSVKVNTRQIKKRRTIQTTLREFAPTVAGIPFQLGYGDRWTRLTSNYHGEVPLQRGGLYPRVVATQVGSQATLNVSQ